MRLCFHPDLTTAGDIVELSREETKHLAACRINQGEIVPLFDLNSRLCNAKVIETGLRARLQLQNDPTVAKSSLPEVTLIAAPIKGSRYDLLIGKAQELGCNRLIPAATEHSIARIPDNKLARWNKLVIEAAKQSGRLPLCRIEQPQTLQQAFSNSDKGLKIILDEKQKSLTLFEIMSEHGKIGQVTFAVGPEGGFTREEVARAEKAQFHPAHLGKAILRSETAGIAALAAALLMYDR
jgi:16S rRNA (uracil1498-N3)-methyltransferase